MDRHAAALALQFLQRVPITAPEINAFLTVTKAINDIAAGTQIVIPARTGDTPMPQPQAG